MPAPLPIRHLQHVGRLTKNLDATKAFYRDVLGFREAVRPGFDFEGAWFDGYGLQIHLIASERAGGGRAEIRPRDHHLAFEVSDMEAVVQLLKEHGIPYKDQHQADTEIRQIFFQDPDGNHVEV